MSSKNPLILITGGAGYIGSHTIIELLNSKQFRVISIDNFSNSSPATFERIKKITGEDVKNYNVDICGLAELEKVFAQHPDISGIIHFAALKAVGESVEKPLLYFNNNNGSLLNILKCMEKYHVPNIIFSSSCTVYGSISQLPVNEQTPLQKPESPYGLTKVMGEQIIESITNSNKAIKATILRYFNPVGAHMSGLIGEDPRNKPNNLVPLITQTVAGKIKELIVYGNDYPTRDGTCIRDYIHVSDIADAHVKALIEIINSPNNYSIYNLGSGKGVSVLEVINAFERSTGKKINYKVGPRRPGDIAAIYSDSSLAEKKLNWKPKYPIEDMMLSAWKWQQNQS